MTTEEKKRALAQRITELEIQLGDCDYYPDTHTVSLGKLPYTIKGLKAYLLELEIRAGVKEMPEPTIEELLAQFSSPMPLLFQQVIETETEESIRTLSERANFPETSSD